MIDTSQITSADFMAPSPDPGIALYMRNKRPAGMDGFRPERTLLYVHGATYPASTAFDLQLDGFSWMDYIAARGYDVWLLDLRGYGKSVRPPEMDGPADAGSPIVRGDIAVRDIGTAVDFILQKRGLSKLCLLGWSWGTTTTATYTARNAQKVQRLVLYAPSWIRHTPALTDTGEGRLGVYRVVTREQAHSRWYHGVPAHKQDALIPSGWFDAWADATWATDEWGARQSPPLLRAPNGVRQDGAEFHGAGIAYYDPENITVPTMLVVAEWDADTPPYMAQALFPLLVNAPDKRMVTLAEGTHTICMERNRLKLFAAVQAFFDE